MVHLTEQICSTRIIYRPFSAPGHQTPYERARSPLRPIEAPARPCYRAHIFHRQDAPMIPRYSRPQMASIWEPEAKFRIWFEIEAHALDKMAENGVVPMEAAKAVWEKGAFEVDRIDAIEAEVKHDVIAFLTNRSEEHTSELQSLMRISYAV